MLGAEDVAPRAHIVDDSAEGLSSGQIRQLSTKAVDACLGSDESDVTDMPAVKASIEAGLVATGSRGMQYC